MGSLSPAECAQLFPLTAVALLCGLAHTSYLYPGSLRYTSPLPLDGRVGLLPVIPVVCPGWLTERTPDAGGHSEPGWGMGAEPGMKGLGGHPNLLAQIQRGG